MSASRVLGPVRRANPLRDMQELFDRVQNAERRPPGRWIYAGTYPGDADTTPDSPPFLNGWNNAGGGQRRLRIRRTGEWGLDVEGAVTGGTDGTAVINVSALYRPDEDTPAPGVGGDWVLEAGGDLIFTATDSTVTGGDVTGVGGIIYDFANVGLSLDIEATNQFLVKSQFIAFDVESGTYRISDAFLIDFSGDDFTVAAANDILLDADDEITLETTNNNILLDSGNAVDIDADGNITLLSQNDINIQANNQLTLFGQIIVSLYLGTSFEIRDDTNTAIFRVDNDGTVHMKAGASIFYDL